MLNTRRKQRNNLLTNSRLKNNNQSFNLSGNRPFPGTALFAPATADITLVYQDSSMTRFNSGATFAYYRMRANGLYDPDPLLATGGISGFLEWGSIYRKYVVTDVHYEWKVTNREVFPVNIVTAVGNVDLVAAVSSVNAAADIAELKYSSTAVLSAAGGQDRAVINKTVHLPKVHGRPEQYLGDDNYSGFGGAAPSNPNTLLYIHFAAYSTANMAVGCDVVLRIKFRVTWYDVQSPIDRLLRSNEDEKARVIGEWVELSESCCRPDNAD